MQIGPSVGADVGVVDTGVGWLGAHDARSTAAPTRSAFTPLRTARCHRPFRPQASAISGAVQLIDAGWTAR
jgi:hypothetical protein